MDSIDNITCSACKLTYASCNTTLHKLRCRPVTLSTEASSRITQNVETDFQSKLILNGQEKTDEMPNIYP
jgi:hypothetical protein